ncbi:MAG: amidohydrolase [Deltaproteobacteria bacterium]
MHCDTLIRNGTILTDAATPLIEDGFVAIAGKEIIALGPLAELPPALAPRTVIDASRRLVMPGLINCHTHAAMTLFRGLADDLPLMRWLNDHIFPAEAAHVSEKMVYNCSLLAAAEMLLSGTTTVADGYFYEEMAAQAYADIGIRAVAAQGIIDFPAPGVPDPKRNIETAERFLRKWQVNNKRITPALFCHSPYTCSDQTLSKAKELSESLGAPLFIHLAETKAEVEQVRQATGMTPGRYLESLGLLGEATICVHSVHLDEEELELLASTRTKVATCPESNMKLASGCARLPVMLALGIPVGLGTDGCASNNDLDLFGEMDSCAKLHKLVSDEPTAVTANQVLAMATTNGAEVLGQASRIGSLAPGKKADIILLDLWQPHLTPFYGKDLLVYAGRGADVTDVFVDGRQLVAGRQLITIDLEKVMADVRQRSTLLKRAL